MLFKRKWLTTKYGSSYREVEKEVSEITNQLYLKIIAKKASEHDLQVLAVNSIKSQSFLIKLIDSTPNIDVKIAALQRIEDKSKRLPIALSVIRDPKTDDYYRIKSIESVIDVYDKAQEDLTAILSHASDGDAICAAELLKDKEEAQRVFISVALKSDNCCYRKDAIEHIFGDDTLLRIVETTKYDETAIAAANRIGNYADGQTAFREIALGKRFKIKSRFEAAGKLNNKEYKKAAYNDILPMAEARTWDQSGECTWTNSDMVHIARVCRQFLESYDEHPI